MDSLGVFLICMLAVVGVSALIAWIWHSNNKRINEEVEQRKKEVEQREKEELRDQKLSEQRRLANEQKSLAYMFGTAKRDKMIRDENENRRKAAYALRDLAFIVGESAAEEKEHDWAIMGGIAEGLAGPAAGIATAVQAMEENTRIRARNAANKANVEKMKNDMLKQSIEWASKPGESRQCQTVAWWSPRSLFKQLAIDTQSISVDPETKAVTVAVYIYTPQYTIDGAIRAKLYTSEGKYAGCAYLVLPKNGTLLERGAMHIGISGICAEPIYKEDVYKVKFEPVNLWELFWDYQKENPPEEQAGVSGGLKKITPEERDKILKRIEDRFQKEEKEAMAQACLQSE